jgi:GcrA cell cycle regulator
LKPRSPNAPRKPLARLRVDEPSLPVFSELIRGMVSVAARRQPSYGTCQWPDGDMRSGGMRFCGAQPMTGRPYCVDHCAIAYEPVRSRHDKTPLTIDELGAARL